MRNRIEAKPLSIALAALAMAVATATVACDRNADSVSTIEAASTPASADPAAADPGSADPASGGSAAADPGSGDPAAADPGTADPASGDSAAADPGSGDPAAADPGSADPASGDPAAAEAPVQPDELAEEQIAPFITAIRSVAEADAHEREGSLAQVDFIRGPLGEDNALHVVALWSIEGPYGSNSWMQRLGLFRPTGQDGDIETVRILDAGERASRDISRLMEIRGSQLVMTVQLWAEDDPSCCPTPDPQIVACDLLHESDCALRRP